MDIASLATGVLKGLWKAVEAVWAFFSSPMVEVLQPGTVFGRFGRDQFALLLKLKFRNESERPTLVRLVRVLWRDQWYDPQPRLPSRVGLDTAHGSHGQRFEAQESLMETPRIPPVEQVERYALFLLPEPGEPFPTTMEFTVEVVFSRGKSRKLPVMVPAQ